MLEKSKHDIIIDELTNKLTEIEYELKSLMYMHMILSQYAQETRDQKEIERILMKIEELIKQLEAIKKEILNKMDGKDYQINMTLDVTGDGKVDVDDFKTIYIKTIDKITEFEKTLATEKELALKRQEEIGLTDKQYEEGLKKLDEQLGISKELDLRLAKTREYIASLNAKVGKTFNEVDRYYMESIRELRADTRLLLNLSAASMLVPRIGPVRSAVAMAAGLALMRDALFPRQELRRERYIEQVDYESEIRYGMRNTSEATKYVEQSRKSIYEIKKQLEEQFRDYPQYKELLTDFDKVEMELDRQEKEIIYLNKMLANQLDKNNSKVLKLELENPQY
jgi:hypothetical protein